MTSRLRFGSLPPAACIALAFAIAAPASAQRLPPLPGTRIRLEVDSLPPLSGVVVRQTMHTLTLMADGYVTPPIDESRILHAQQYVARGSIRYVLIGLATGAVVGGAVGGYFAHRDYARCERQREHDLCGLAGLEVPVLVLGGAATGLVVGAFVKVRRWESLF